VAPEPIWMTWRGENLVPTGIRTPTLQSSSPYSVAIPTALFRLLSIKKAGLELK
jgi:hypothetical protein